jgi:hypothetical protein
MNPNSPLNKPLRMATVDLTCHCGRAMRGPKTKKDCSDGCKKARVKREREERVYGKKS